MMGQAILADDDFYVNPEIIFVSEDLDDPAAWILGCGWPVGDFYIYDYVFQVFPVAACGFISQHPVAGFPLRLFRLWLSGIRCVRRGFHRGVLLTFWDYDLLRNF